MARKTAAVENDDPGDFLALGVRLRDELDAAPDTMPDIAKRYGLGIRKAYYLVDIAKAFDRLPVPRARLLRIGWTKLKTISERVNRDNLSELLDLAEAHPVHRLEEILEGGDPEGQKHAVMLYLTPDQYDVFRRVLVAHGARAGAKGLAEKEEALTKALSRIDAM